MSPKITQAQRDHKRKEILEAAMRVFTRQGYQATTMKDIVEESGLSRGGVYLYFTSTKEMLIEIIEDMDRESYDQLDQLLTHYPSVWSAINALFDQAELEIKNFETGLIPALYEALMFGWRNKTYEDLNNARYERTIARIVDLLQAGVERGEFRPLQPLETIASMIATFNDGIMIHAMQLGPERSRTPEQIQAYKQVFKHLLGVQEEETP